MWGRHRRPSVVETIVPQGEPILLPAFYEEFLDYYPQCELQTKRWMNEQVKEDWVCIDVGANIGYHSILMSRLASKGLIFAFEPTITSRMLRKNLKFNNVLNVEVLEQAVGAVSGNKEEELYRIWGKKPEKRSYQFITIDDFVKSRELTRLDFIKVDVDGFDVEVLEGAKETLSRLNPVVLVELNHALSTRNRSSAEAFELLLAAKYDKCLVLDSHNYVFSRNWKIGHPWPHEVRVAFDKRDPLSEMTPVVAGDSVADIGNQWLLHNSATIGEDGFITTSGPPWEYALSFPLQDCEVGLGVVIDIEVILGEAGVFLSDKGGTMVFGAEIRAGCGKSQIVLDKTDSHATQLIIRKTTPEVLLVRVNSCTIHPIGRQTNSVKPMLDEISSADLETITSETKSEGWTSYPLSKISTVKREDLHLSLGIDQALEPIQVLFSPASLAMEREDAPILRYLFEHISPSRHLEIGTWEGFGVALCLQSCSAEIWTINLQTGEKREGAAVYPTSREPFHPKNPGMTSRCSDAGSSVGWMYRATGLGARVHQLWGNSVDIENQSLPAEGFDTIFIDGSHSRDDVQKDIDNSLKLAKEGGWIFVHDFTLESSVVKAQKSTGAVLAAVADRIERLNARFELLWVKDTMLLILKPRPVL